jgi:hypothetical protein
MAPVLETDMILSQLEQQQVTAKVAFPFYSTFHLDKAGA